MKTRGIHLAALCVAVVCLAWGSPSFAERDRRHTPDQSFDRDRSINENYEHDDHEDDEVERRYRPEYADDATGDADDAYRVDSIWPVDVRSIGNTNASFQDYGTGAYFHHGIDIRADGGSEVWTCTAGRVVAIQKYGATDLYWEVAIQDDQGFIWQYHHVDKDSITPQMRESLQNGTRIAQGTPVGRVVIWPESAMGERYDHVHINVIGAGGIYLNPQDFLPPIQDTVAPWVNRISLMQNGQSIGGQQATGNYSLSADVGDLVYSDRHLVPPHRISFSVDGGEEHLVWSFENLPGGASKTDYVYDFYVRGEASGGYQPKQFVVDLGFNGNYQYLPRERGSHNVRVFVEDHAGNWNSSDFDYNIY
jgi:hypothetical protein